MFSHFKINPFALMNRPACNLLFITTGVPRSRYLRFVFPLAEQMTKNWFEKKWEMEMNNLFTQRVFTYTNFFSCFNSVVGRRKKSERIVSKETVRRGFATQRLEEIWHVIDFPNFASTFYSKRFGCVFFFLAACFCFIDDGRRRFLFSQFHFVATLPRIRLHRPNGTQFVA